MKQGIAVCRAELPREDVARIGDQREPFRYKHRTVLAPREAALSHAHGDPFADPNTVKPMRIDVDDPFCLNDEFLEVPERVLKPSLWHEAFAVHMQHEEHITLLEGRGIVAALRHKLRSKDQFGCRHLHFNDNMGAVLMCSKGRSGVFPMLKICRRVCALLLASDSVFSARWIPSELNIADGPSRRWESLRKDHAASRSQEKSYKQAVDEVCYPKRAGRYDFGEALFGSRDLQEQALREEACFPKDSSREGQSEKGEDSPEIRSSKISGSDGSREDGSLRAGSMGLHEAHRRPKGLCQGEQAQLEGHPEVRRGLLQVSQQHFRARHRPPRGDQILGGSSRRIPRLCPQELPGAHPACPTRMVKNRSAEDTATDPMGPDSCNGDEDGCSKEDAISNGSAHHVHSLLEAKRMFGPDEGGRGASDATSAFSHPSSSSFTAAGSFQGGAFRRKPASGLHDDAMVGLRADGSAVSRTFSVQPELHRAGDCLEAVSGRSGAAASPCSALPAKALGSFPRSFPSASNDCRDQGSGKMDLGLKSPSLRGTWETQPRIFSVARVHSEVSSTFGKAVQHSGPKVFLPSSETKPKGIVVELFSGCARLSEACAAAGYIAIAFDIEYGSGCDLLCKTVQYRLVRFIKRWHDYIKMIWLGTPCTSWSRARRLDGGPQPLRDDTDNLFGFKHLNQKDLERVEQGNLFLDVSKYFIDLALRFSLHWVLENPFTSRIWLTPHLRALQSLGGQLHEVHFCAYGTPWRKSTGLLSNIAALHTIVRLCHPQLGRCQHSGKRHVILSGKDKSGVWLTRRAQPYPFALCEAVASVLDAA